MSEEKTGLEHSYTDEKTGITLPSAWLQIRQINYIPNVSCHVVLDVYVNNSEYKAKKQPLIYNVLNHTTHTQEAFTTYFSTDALASSSITVKAMEYLQELFPVE